MRGATCHGLRRGPLLRQGPESVDEKSGASPKKAGRAGRIASPPSSHRWAGARAWRAPSCLACRSLVGVQRHQSISAKIWVDAGSTSDQLCVEFRPISGRTPADFVSAAYVAVVSRRSGAWRADRLRNAALPRRVIPRGRWRRSVALRGDDGARGFMVERDADAPSVVLRAAERYLGRAPSIPDPPQIGQTLTRHPGLTQIDPRSAPDRPPTAPHPMPHIDPS